MVQALINAAEGFQQFKCSTQEEKHCVSEEKECNYLWKKILNLRYISVPRNQCKADSESTASALLLSPLQDMLAPSLLARENLGQVEGSSWEK